MMQDVTGVPFQLLFPSLYGSRDVLVSLEEHQLCSSAYQLHRLSCIGRGSHRLKWKNEPWKGM